MKRILLFACIAVLVSVQAWAGPIQITGTTSGVFENPYGPAGMVTSGVGTSTMTWGVGSPPPVNSVSFAGLAFDTFTEVNFKLGDFAYYNGTVVAGTEANGFDLVVSVEFTLPTGITEVFTFPITVNNTPNTGTPQEQADVLTLAQLYSMQTFVYDGVTYQVHLLGWQNPNADGFVVGGNEFHVYENGTGSAELWGKVTQEIVGVPDPASTLLLLGMSLAGLAAWRRRRT